MKRGWYMMKQRTGRMLGILCAGCMAVSGAACAVPAAAADGFDPETAVFGIHAEGTCGDNVTWSLDEETGTLTISGTGDMKMTARVLMLGLQPLADSVTAVVIGEGVTGICDGAFANFEKLTSVSLPESLKTIGRGAFRCCKQLAELTVPDGVEDIGVCAFLATPWLEQQKETESLIIAGRVLLCCGNGSIGEPLSEAEYHAIAGEDAYYDGQLYALTIPDGVQTIADEAFAGCWDMVKLTVPEGVEKIGSNAFYGCCNLQQVSLPDSLQEVGAQAFNAAGLGSDFEIPESVLQIARDAFRATEWLEQKQATEPFVIINGILISAGTAKTGEVIIPDGVEKIGPYAFCQCEEITSVVMPDSVTEIGEGAFAGCTGLASVRFPAGLESISEDAFYGCAALASVDLPEGVRTVGDSAFCGCTALTELDLPALLEEIGSRAFAECPSLTEVEFPDALKSIGEGAFGSDGLLSVVLPEGLESLGIYAFSENGQLGEITIPEGLLDIGAGAFDGTLWQNDHLDTDMFVILNDVLMCGSTEAIGEIAVPEGVREIADDAFRNCTELLKVLIPDTVTKIGDGAFENSGLTEVLIPESVTELGIGAFANCTDLTAVTLPDDLKTIGTSAFLGCFNLETLIVPSGVTKIADNAFEACSKLTLCGEEGSCAESYAKEHRIPFRVLDADPTGDVNCSGSVDVSDAVLLARYLVSDSGAVISGQGLANADCDKNGLRDDADLTMILQYIAKKITF